MLLHLQTTLRLKQDEERSVSWCLLCTIPMVWAMGATTGQIFALQIGLNRMERAKYFVL